MTGIAKNNRLVMVYREASDHRSAVESFIRDYKKRTNRVIETINPDDRDGVNFCRLHDIVEYPTLVVIGYDGAVHHQWRGVMLPTISEVAVVAGD